MRESASHGGPRVQYGNFSSAHVCILIFTSQGLAHEFAHDVGLGRRMVLDCLSGLRDMFRRYCQLRKILPYSRSWY